MAISTRQRQTSTEWSAAITSSEVTAETAVNKLQEAVDYSKDAVDAVMATLGTGTLPPAKDLMPALYDARDKVEQAIGALASVKERAPQSIVGKQYVDLGRQLGARLIDESNAAMDKAKASESPVQLATQLAAAGARVAEKAAGGIFSLGGKLLTPMEIILGGLLIDEILNKGKFRRRLLGGKA